MLVRLDHKMEALSRSLRIFGVSLQGRACPTMDERAKRVMYVECETAAGDIRVR
jgi:hypothetical protein